MAAVFAKLLVVVAIIGAVMGASPELWLTGLLCAGMSWGLRARPTIQR